MSYLKKGIKGISILMALTVLGNFIGYFTRMVMTRNISQEQYGLFYAVLSVAMFLLTFSNMGFGSAMVKYVAEFRANKRYGEMKFMLLFTTVPRMIISILLGAGVFLFSDVLAKYYFKTPDVLTISLFSVGIVLMTSNQILSRVFNAIQNNLLMGMSEFLQKLFFLGFLITFIYMGYTKNASLAAYAFLASSLVALALLLIPAIKQTEVFKHKSIASRSLAKSASFFALASFLTGVSYLIIGYIDTMMLTYFRSLEEVAVYNVVLPTVMVLSFFSKSVSNVFFPIVSELWAKKLKERLTKGYNTLQKYSLVLIAPITLVLLVFPKLILNLLFGSQYVGGYIAMMILSLGIIFLTLGVIGQAVLLGVGYPKEITKILIISAGFNFIANLIVIPLFGINGAAATTTLSYFIIMVLQFRKLRGIVDIPFDYMQWLKIIVCSLVFVGVVEVVRLILDINQYLEAAICLVAAFSLYLFVGYFLKLIDLNEIKFFIKNLVRR